MKNLSVIVAILCLLFSSTTSFADKVVVIPLGKTVNIEASINWLGDWTDNTDYLEGDAIQYQGSSYLCIQEHVSVNPPPHANWDLMASKGSQGETGDQGLQGSPGTDGADGAQGSPGTDGVDGSPGTDGSQGIQGEKGDPGAQGEKGDVGPAGSGAVKVYDAGNNYLGIYMGFGSYPYDDDHDIFNPATSGMLRLDRSTGEIVISTSHIFYLQPDCQGDWYFSIGDAKAKQGFLGRIGNQYYSIPLMPTVNTNNSHTSSRRVLNSSSGEVDDCMNIGWSGDLFQATLYTDAEVGFTFPLSFPLRFEVTP